MHATQSPARRPATSMPLPVDSGCRDSSGPLVVGHRGAPAYHLEHTLDGFDLAIDLGADLIEPDVLVCRDGALIVRHESALSLTTDIPDRPEFAHRRKTRVQAGRAVTDWFIEDFDLDELRTLRAVERSPGLRPMNTVFDGQGEIVTISEVLDLALAKSTPQRTIGVLVELSPRLTGIGTELPDLLAAELRRRQDAGLDDSVTLQAFEPHILRSLRDDLGDAGPNMVQLIDDGSDFDWMLETPGLLEIAEYAQAVGPNRHRVLLRNADDSLNGTSDVVDRAHDVGLGVYVWTLAPENAFLPVEWRRGWHPHGYGDSKREAQLLIQLGVEAVITDAPDIAVQARAELNGALAG